MEGFVLLNKSVMKEFEILPCVGDSRVCPFHLFYWAGPLAIIDPRFA